MWTALKTETSTDSVADCADKSGKASLPIHRKLYNFFKTGGDKPLINDPIAVRKLYERARWSVFVSTTLGYGLFYVCRLTISVAKKPMMEEGIMDAAQMGIMGSALFFTYAFGKFLNGFMADRMNIRKFMAIGLFVSALANIAIGFTWVFPAFVVLWGINGWFQSLGAAPSVVSIAHWFSNRERGTRYGFWSASHNIGAAFTFVITAFIVSTFGWRHGFIIPGLVCVAGAVAFYIFMYDRPQVYGLPPVADYKNDHGERIGKDESLWELQKEVLKNPAVWMLGLASAFFYIARYAIESWGVVYLGAAKGYSTVLASSVISSNPIFGIIGTVSAGYISDRFFGGRRNVIALVVGVLFSASFVGFAYAPAASVTMHVVCMSVSGFCLGVLLAFLGGLMAVDICSKRAAGAAMGMIGLFSYLAAALQDLVSGYLIKSHTTIVNGEKVYDFSPVLIFWIGSAVLSFLFAATVWKAKYKD